MAGNVMIECEGLTKGFGHFTAVDHVSFQIEKGSIFGFLGPSGSGKSTVIRRLCGLLQPSAGRARIGGLDLARELDQIKTRIAFWCNIAILAGMGLAVFSRCALRFMQRIA
jgi:ABC-2 type transport system ATP-binding protein